MKIKRLLVAATLLAVLLFPTACLVTVDPQTSDLRHVHDVYTDEFAVMNVPAASTEPTQAAASGAAFAKSLHAIHEYRAKYPGNAAELAHLQVLEGMIYIQSGRFGLASAVSQDVKQAAAHLSSGTGELVRDRLFAQNFDALLEGWRETQKDNNQQWQTFEHAASRLETGLNSVRPGERPSVDKDQGALYLATTAAIFYVWAAQRQSLSHDSASAPANRLEWYKKGRDLIGQYLTEAEKTADVSHDMGSSAETVPQGRLRYVQWYHWLDGQLRS